MVSIDDLQEVVRGLLQQNAKRGFSVSRCKWMICIPHTNK